jgi:hypothetical protein
MKTTQVKRKFCEEAYYNKVYLCKRVVRTEIKKSPTRNKKYHLLINTLASQRAGSGTVARFALCEAFMSM